MRLNTSTKWVLISSDGYNELQKWEYMIKAMVFEMYVLTGLYFIVFLIRMNFQLGDIET